ncbi:MAG: hypothetical protein LBP59_04965 [Planctomycetaceae bacterium]|nr:hypothetical protein [Planctomycetaceae bacterium]
MSTTACRRDARDPSVSPAFQDRRRDIRVPSRFFVTKNLLSSFFKTIPLPSTLYPLPPTPYPLSPTP